jgi:hypothetical protein
MQVLSSGIAAGGCGSYRGQIQLPPLAACLIAVDSQLQLRYHSFYARFVNRIIIA